MLQILNAEISLIGVLIAVLANMVIGMVWYGPFLGEKWMQAIGKKKTELKANGSDYALTLGSAFVTATFMSLVVSYGFINSQFASSFSLNGTNDFILSGAWSDIAAGLMIGLFVWLIATVPSLVNRLVWEGANRQLIAINAGHSLTSMLSMGVIVALAMNLS